MTYIALSGCQRHHREGRVESEKLHFCQGKWDGQTGSY